MAKFSFFFVLASLLCAIFATETVPNTVYRADTRGPDKIRAAAGFKSFGTNKVITLIEHATKQYDKGHRQGQDPWISTSGLSTIGEQKVVDKPCWVYTIDTSGIDSRFTQVEAAFAAANKPNTRASEDEWAAELEIPLGSITSFYKLSKTLVPGQVYTWETWEAHKKSEQAKKEASSKTKGSGSSSSKKTSRDGIPMVKKAGTPGAAAFRSYL